MNETIITVSLRGKCPKCGTRIVMHPPRPNKKAVDAVWGSFDRAFEHMDKAFGRLSSIFKRDA